MYVCVCVCVCVCVYVCMYVCMCIYIYTVVYTVYAVYRLSTWEHASAHAWSSCMVLIAQISNEVSLKLSINCYFRNLYAVGVLCQRCDSCDFQSHSWIMASKKAVKKSCRKFPTNVQSSKLRKTIAKVLFPAKKAWGEVPATCWGWPWKWHPNLISHAHLTYFPVWENCVLESIEEPLAKKMKTTESCVETSDEDAKYNDDDLSSDNLRGDQTISEVAISEATRQSQKWQSQRWQPAWRQPRRWANLGNGFISSIVL